MFGIGFFELAVIAVFALIFIGPKKLPDFMRQAGKFFVHMRRTANEVRSGFDSVIREAEEDIRREEAATMRALLSKESHQVEKSDDRKSAITPNDGDSKDQSTLPNHRSAPSGTEPFQPGLANVQDAQWSSSDEHGTTPSPHPDKSKGPQK